MICLSVFTIDHYHTHCSMCKMQTLTNDAEKAKGNSIVLNMHTENSNRTCLTQFTHLDVTFAMLAVQLAIVFPIWPKLEELYILNAFSVADSESMAARQH